MPFEFLLGFSGARTGEPRHLARPLRPRRPGDCAARERTVDRRAASRASTSASIGIGKRTDPNAEAQRGQGVSSIR